jgi:hypothetical protein
MERKTEMRRFWIPGAVVVAFAAVLIAQASAGNGPGSTVLKFKTMVGTVAPYTGPANAIRGVSGAGAPWSIDTANGKLDENGDLSLKVTGLIITGTGANPVPTFRAVVSCQSIVGGAAVVVNRVSTPFPPPRPAMPRSRATWIYRSRASRRSCSSRPGRAIRRGSGSR